MTGDLDARVITHEIALTYVMQQLMRADPGFAEKMRALPRSMAQVLREQRVNIGRSAISHALDPDTIQELLEELIEAAGSDE